MYYIMKMIGLESVYNFSGSFITTYHILSWTLSALGKKELACFCAHKIFELIKILLQDPVKDMFNHAK